jgi:hypothetical protein
MSWTLLWRILQMTDLHLGSLVDSLADTGEAPVPTLVSDRSRPFSDLRTRPAKVCSWE